jgi:hypothetical protein
MSLVRRSSLALAVALAAGLGVVSGPLPAAACGGLFCQRMPVEQAGERILFATDGENVTAHVQIQYQGAAKDFSWIVPTPTEPKLAVGSEALFTALRFPTQPRFRVDIDKTEGECDQRASARGPATTGAVAAPQAAPGVAVVSQENIGPFATAVLQANDTAMLKSWLTENGYTVPAALDPLLDPYVSGKYYFIALKLQKDRDAGDLQPIVFSYKSTKPGIPIRLTGVAATEDMGVYVWVLGKERAVPENYRHAEINEARIDWTSGGGNYPQVVTEAMNEAGGQAFVTDYAGKSSKIQLTQFDTAPLETFLAELAQKADPVAFVQHVMSNGYRLQQVPAAAPMAMPMGSPKVLSFLKRHVPKPEALKDVEDATFYAQIAQYEAELKAAQTTVDPVAAAKELEETLVAPLRDIKKMFEAHPYLTRLYTTMSPDEMTQDPMFVFNKDMGDVDNEHVAKGVRKCAKDVDFNWAPVEITLKNGIKFTVSGDPNGGPRVTPATGSGGKKVDMPAALRIEQTKTSGKASLITDNRGKIMQVLAALASGNAAISIDAGTGNAVAVNVGGGGTTTTSGFGCAGCANPAKAAAGGAGEGTTFALFALGLAGWRWRARRKRG